jgi:hypothetical protein
MKQVIYHNEQYELLCFAHAVAQVNAGKFVHSSVAKDSEYRSCQICMWGARKSETK